MIKFHPMVTHSFAKDIISDCALEARAKNWLGVQFTAQPCLRLINFHARPLAACLLRSINFAASRRRKTILVLCTGNFGAIACGPLNVITEHDASVQMIDAST